MHSSMARPRSAGTFFGVSSARRSKAPSMRDCRWDRSVMAQRCPSANQGADTFGGFDALRNAGDQRDSHAPGARIDSIVGACEITAGQHRNIPGGKQITGKLLVICANISPQIEPTVGTLDVEHIR